MRCLALAAALRDRGAAPLFVSRELPGGLSCLVADQGFAVRRLAPPDPMGGFQPETEYAGWLGVPWQTDAREVAEQLQHSPRPDWLIVDSYAIDARWERSLRHLARRIMVIDDLADRPHDCELLLDQNLCADMESRYEGLVSDTCRLLLGPRHALLRAEFLEARRRLRSRDGSVGRLLLFLGGSDQGNQTGKVLRALRQLDRPGLAVDVVVGASNPHRDEIRATCAATPGTLYHYQVDNMAELMLQADLAIGAAGSTTWERCYLGLPSLLLVLADNQFAGAKGAAAAGAAICLGACGAVTADHIAGVLGSLLGDPAAVREMGRRALAVMGEPPGCDGSALLDILLEE